MPESPKVYPEQHHKPANTREAKQESVDDTEVQGNREKNAESPPTIAELLKSPEELKSERIARRKLEILMADDFRDFAIRFVNIGEYRDIMREERFEHREAFVFKYWPQPDDDNFMFYNFSEWFDHYGGAASPTFKEYLRSGAPDWGDLAAIQSNCPWSTYDIATYEFLIDLLRQSHQEIQKEHKGPTMKNTRIATLDRFRSKVLSKLTKGDLRFQWSKAKISAVQADRKINLSILQHASNFDVASAESTQHYIREQEQELISLIGEALTREVIMVADMLVQDRKTKRSTQLSEHMLTPILKKSDSNVSMYSPFTQQITELAQNILREKIRLRGIDQKKLTLTREFLSNPKFLHKRENLRPLLSALSYTGTAKEQYHVALVFDLEAITDRISEGNRWWRFLRSRGANDYRPQEHLLAAIAAMPDRELSEELTVGSSRGQEWAHAVFTNQGTLRYPKP